MLATALQRAEIDPVLAGARGIADADGVDHDAVLLGDVGGVLGRHAARGVVAVGQQDQQLLLCRLVSSVLIASPMVSPIAVCCPAMPTWVCSSNCSAVCRSCVNGTCT